MKDDRLIFEKSRNGSKAYSLPDLDVPEVNPEACIPAEMLRGADAQLPEVSEVDVVRHYTLLSQKNYGVDSGFYPLGSCTMKYNPKINEDMASLKGFRMLHPLQDETTVQGALRLMYELEGMLCEIAGMDAFTLQPAAGAHGEQTGLMLIKAYHEKKGDLQRNKIIVPDSAHGTNPASAHTAGFEIIEVESHADGSVNVEKLREVLGEDTAGLMLTNPSTLGLFERNIKVIAEMVHEAGGLLYYDGANANAIMGKSRPGDMGFDVIHFNLHKTFSTPHGGGGPGSGPVGVKEILRPFLPVPVVGCSESRFFLDSSSADTIGKVKSFYGNFGVMVKAYAYILTMGAAGLRKASELAVLNANYLMKRLETGYDRASDRICMHEFVLAGLKNPVEGIHTIDIAKRLIDYGFHPPTVYFPLIVKEAIMIEPTETESRETLDVFAEAMLAIADEAETDPGLLQNAPHNAPVGRPDEVRAAKKLVLRWKKESGSAEQ